jgi:DNA-binding XRE family transcriptional regulator
VIDLIDRKGHRLPLTRHRFIGAAFVLREGLPCAFSGLPVKANFPSFSVRTERSYDGSMKSITRPHFNQLRKYRKARGLSQVDAAHILGFADGSRISRWERGQCLPTTINLFRLAAAYKTMVDALYIDVLREIRNEVQTREQQVLTQRHGHDR